MEIRENTIQKYEKYEFGQDDFNKRNHISIIISSDIFMLIPGSGKI
jgi:hypothetical protein